MLHCCTYEPVRLPRNAMDPARRKAILKSVRFDAQDAEILSKEAKAVGLTFNALVSRLVTRFVEWDRFADRYGFIALPRQSFRTLVSQMDRRQLEEFGRATGHGNVAAITQFWFKRLDFDSFLSFLAISAKYAKIWHYELAQRGDQVVLTVLNDIGPSYAAVHREYFDQAIREILGVKPHIEQRGDAVVFTFLAPGSR